ncbi:MAG TPA: OmpA family protein [Kofleriaceae bacterium]|nr:OmpA family protein [Kofleriaceae bacterium]
MKHTAIALLLTAAAACGPKTTAPPKEPAPAAGDEPASTGERTPTTSFELQDNKLVLPGPIVFTADALDVKASQAALWYIHDYLVSKDYITLVRLEGHGDQPGQEAMIFSGAQALAVGEWLVASGVDCKRLLAVAFGDSKPVADPSTAEGRAQNRRIEVVNAELRGKAIGGMPVDGGGVAAPVCD